MVPPSVRHRPPTRPINDRQQELVHPKLDRHANPPNRLIRAGLLNIRSVRNKTDNVPEIFNEFNLNVLFLTETWHECADSVAIKRLRGLGLNVIEAARDLPVSENLDSTHFVNHGGIAVISRPGTVVAKVDSKFKPKSFEHLCCRVGSGSASLIIVAIYRPGSQSVRQLFFAELTTLLESMLTYNCGILIVCDLNVHLERPSDVDSQKLELLISSFDLKQFVHDSTHVHGGLLDVVISSGKCEPLDVTAVEVGLSDHKLVHWTLPIAPQNEQYVTTLRRKWRHFELERFIERLEQSPLCAPVDPSSTGSDLALLYQSVITEILDDVAPMSRITVRPRKHRPFYDRECRQARRRARRLERVYRKKKGSTTEADALSSWRDALRASRSLVRRKGRQYWRHAIDSVQSDTKQT